MVRYMIIFLVLGMVSCSDSRRKFSEREELGIRLEQLKGHFSSKSYENDSKAESEYSGSRYMFYPKYPEISVSTEYKKNGELVSITYQVQFLARDVKGSMERMSIVKNSIEKVSKLGGMFAGEEWLNILKHWRDKEYVNKPKYYNNIPFKDENKELSSYAVIDNPEKFTIVLGISTLKDFPLKEEK